MPSDEILEALKESRKKVINLLRDKGLTIHSKISYSSRSSYLKVEYGLGGSIRFSDHGDRGLSYSFNILYGIEKKYEIDEGGVKRVYYPIGCEEDLVADVLEKYNKTILKYGEEGSKRVISRIKSEAKIQKKSGRGFWAGAIELK